MLSRCRLGGSRFIVGVASLFTVVAQLVSDRCKPSGIPAVEVAISAAAGSLLDLVVVFESKSFRGDTAKEVGANEDGVIAGGYW